MTVRPRPRLRSRLLTLTTAVLLAAATGEAIDLSSRSASPDVAPAAATSVLLKTPIHIANTGAVGAVNIRTGSNTGAAVLGSIPEGATPEYHYFVRDEKVNDVPVWFYVTYKGVTGFYSSYYDDAHYNSDTELTAKYGVPLYGSDGATAAVPPAEPTSVFFSPISHEPHAYGTTNIATVDVELEGWKSNVRCETSKAVSAVPAGTTTLSGWSLGRLGPLYFLKGAGPDRVAQIKTIVLYDPGNLGEFQDSCDKSIDVNGLLANWLKGDSDRRLIILTGGTTEDKNAFGTSKFTGLWKYYLAGIWNQSFANRAMICDYDKMDHFEVLNQFRYATRMPPLSCQTAPDGTPAIQWHP